MNVAAIYPGDGAIHLIVWFCVSIVLLSFIEYVLHRDFMHRKVFSGRLHRRLPFLEEYFRIHAILHHTTYYRCFNYEPDPKGREIDIRLGFRTGFRLFITIIPLVFVLGSVEPAGGILFLCMAIGLMNLWGLVHQEMHIPSSPFLQNLAMYRFLARRHFLHHRYPARNYNVVIPIVDWLMRTVAKAKPTDVRELIRLGFLVPRHQQTYRRLARHKSRPDLPARRGSQGSLSMKIAK